jgi:hypothetical protein
LEVSQRAEEKWESPEWVRWKMQKKKIQQFKLKMLRQKQKNIEKNGHLL